jgi:hypothetical protein
MGRRATKSDEETGGKLYMVLPSGSHALLKVLAEEQVYGPDVTAVARFLLIQKLDELMERGRVRLPLKPDK